MARKHKMSVKGVSLPVGIVIGVLSGVAATILGALLLAYLVLRESVDIGGIGVGAMLVAALASAFGTWLAATLVKEKKLLVCGLTALGFLLVLLSITAVFFDGMFVGIGKITMMILLGAALPLLFTLRKKSNKNKIKIPAFR